MIDPIKRVRIGPKRRGRPSKYEVKIKSVMNNYMTSPAFVKKWEKFLCDMAVYGRSEIRL